MKLRFLTCCAALAIAGFASAATVPEGFELDLLATGLDTPKGIDAVQFRAGAGQMGKYLYVAESGADQIVEVDTRTGDVQYYADSMGTFPVGLACYGGPFGRFMYVGNATVTEGGIVKIDTDGNAETFALDGYGIAGLDFGSGPYGKYLYAGAWATGDIWRIDREGNAEMFASIPTCQTRYLQFSHGGGFGHGLFFTDFYTGDIYRVDPDGQEMLFTSTGSDCLEGLQFSPGGVFGHYMYVGDLCSGEIFRVSPDGTVELWAEGFEGVADIIFKPGGRGGFTMYIVDGHSSVYAISSE